MIRHKEENLPKQELKELQLKRLKEVVLKGWAVPFYKTKMKEHGITPDNIQTLDDIKKLPFMTKDDFQYEFQIHNVFLKTPDTDVEYGKK